MMFQLQFEVHFWMHVTRAYQRDHDAGKAHMQSDDALTVAAPHRRLCQCRPPLIRFSRRRDDPRDGDCPGLPIPVADHDVRVQLAPGRAYGGGP